MKTAVLCLLTIILSMSLYAQDDMSIDDANPSHEIKVNALALVLGAFDASYEYLLNEESAVGINGFVNFDDDNDSSLNYYISPYYRLYFGKQYAYGFFIEGFGMLNSTKADRIQFFDVNDNIISTQSKDVTDFALGIGLGGKWVTKSGYIGEIGLGVGRNLFNTDESTYDFVGKIGITIGYRF